MRPAAWSQVEVLTSHAGASGAFLGCEAQLAVDLVPRLQALMTPRVQRFYDLMCKLHAGGWADADSLLEAFRGA